MHDWFQQIPDVVWAALLASFLTFLGVLLTNHNYYKRQLAELKHDASQRDREREMALRKDVYLEVVTATTTAQNLLMRLSDLNLSDQALATESRQITSPLGRVQLVGTNNTVQAISAVSQEWGAAFLELTLKRIPLIIRKSRMEQLGQFIDGCLAEQDRLNVLMKELNLSGITDKQTWETLKGQFKFEQEKFTQYTEERDILAALQQREVIVFVESCFGRFIAISALIPPAVFALRDELDLPLNKEAYLKTFNDGLEKGKDTFQAFLKKIPEVVKD